jgi:polysaccharide export outer membrane protein
MRPAFSLLVFFLVAGPVCQPAVAADPAPAVELRVGDRLRFAVTEDPETGGDVVVNASGMIDLPLLGLRPAAGRTLEQLTTEVRTALEADYFVRATVRLSLIDRPERAANRGRIFLAGQMRRIGVVEIDLNEKNTVGRVILANGGLGDFADARHIKIVRKSGPAGELETLTVDLEEVLKKGRIDRDVPLLDGDFVLADAKLINW